MHVLKDNKEKKKEKKIPLFFLQLETVTAAGTVYCIKGKKKKKIKPRIEWHYEYLQSTNRNVKITKVKLQKLKWKQELKSFGIVQYNYVK